MADVPDDGFIFHLCHVLGGDDLEVAGGGHEDVSGFNDIIKRGDLEAFHRGLQGTDGVDFGHDDAGALTLERLGTALADVAVATDDSDLAGDHDVGGAEQAVDERVSAAVKVVELALGARVVDVDGGEEELAFFFELVEALDTGGGFFGDALAGLSDAVPTLGVFGKVLAECFEDDAPLFGVVLGVKGWDFACFFVLDALVDEQGRVAAVIDDEVWALAVAEVESDVGAPPVFGQGFALPCEDGHALGLFDRAGGAGDDGCGGVVLG